ncbi:Por secretion system C-terminal sorting domain-containing protein [Candidatus Kryptonium thompsonii]|uniref:N-acetylmuramoyl-L-alanine amidase n=1 Tax=Candidatus Kryptonium thompsonii TaxID=1633631 RepID=A0ABM9USU8_9BACT|nr:Ig-like domain-containing protein [Candidatus Kryptonium thompsoni]CUS77232.1 Por secretion system C-terminal sorting domain-containing protein [Candidatus Kryptonium thompsoni]
MRRIIVFLVLVLSIGVSAQDLKRYFQLASEEFNVPAELLEAIAFVNTRWVHIEPEKFTPACDDKPPVYGIMGLRDDDWFGHSLVEGAKLINVPVEVVKRDVYQNIRAGAALLAKLSNEKGLKKGTSKIEDYKDVVAKFSGIPQPEIAQIFAYDVYKVLSTGFNEFGIEIERKEIDMSIFPKDLFERSGLKIIKPDEINSEDYPPAVWDPSPNYEANRLYTTRIVIHVTQGNFAGSVSWLKNPNSKASAHYVIRSSDGYIVQLVREKDKAWHAKCWNSFTLGIEHEGYIQDPDRWFTPVMYLESAKLVRNMVNRWAIPVDSNHIIGHNFWQQPQWPVVRQEWDFAKYDQGSPSCNDHTDPGPGWNWGYYLSLIRSDQTPPKVISVSPESGARNFLAYKSVVINFSVPMDKSSVQANLVITPNDTVSLIWSSDQRTLEIKPNKFWEFSTTYTIKIDTGAKSVFGLKIDGDGDGVPGDPYYVEFTTTAPDVYPPVVEKGYPVGENVSVYAEMKFVFNEPIESASLASRVRLVDENDQSISITSGKHVVKDDKSIVTFKPASPLLSDKIYKVKFLAGLKDLFGNATTSDYVFEFRTDPGVFYSGSVIDSFETVNSWWQPSQSGSTTGVEANFVASSEKKFRGSNSGKLTYRFLGESGGLIRIFNPSKPTISNGQGNIGLWVYGDLSGNQIEFWFYNPDNYPVNLGSINWYGWKFVSYPIASVPGSNKQFHSIVIKQIQGADKEGEIYFDDLQVGGKITSVAQNEIPVDFSLEQNYPNPFNSSTLIRFSLPERVQVKLCVYDILGRLIAVIVDSELEPGVHTVKFEADDLPSGVYFYRINAGGFFSVRKMVLMK